MGPLTTYEERLAQRQAHRAHLQEQDRRLSAARGGVFLLGLLLWWVVVGPQVITPWILLVPVVVFLALAVVHERTARAIQQASRAVAFYEAGLARLDGTWPGRGDPGADLIPADHPYAEDLDILGRGSLFELVCRARSIAGRRRLAGWLLEAGAPEVVRRRQAAVAEMAGALDLREELAVVGDDVKGANDRGSLVAWAQQPVAEVHPAVRLVSALLALVNLATLVAWFVTGSGTVFLVAILVSAVWSAAQRARIQAVLRGTAGASDELRLLRDVLRRLETGTFTSPHLQELKGTVEGHGHPASLEIARLAKLLDLLESRRNQMFMPLAGLLLFTTQLGDAVASWRRRCGPRVESWTSAVGELEALASLGGQCFEHPEDTFAEIVEGPVFEANGAAHPLLTEARAVRNDVDFGEVRLLLVSGSNMSGKSTLLRTVGTNAVLALAGGPVRARSLRLGRVQIGASIRVQDSLLAGSSRFFAEISRLRRLMELAREQPPLLFLLDEVLGGTNSADRKAGAEAIVRGLLERGAFGLVTTHDLALAESVEALGPRAANVHFEDHLEDGQLRFDYRLKPGVVKRSNAIALMRAVGLMT
jgi:hypothetical protein